MSGGSRYRARLPDRGLSLHVQLVLLHLDQIIVRSWLARAARRLAVTLHRRTLFDGQLRLGTHDGANPAHRAFVAQFRLAFG